MDSTSAEVESAAYDNLLFYQKKVKHQVAIMQDKASTSEKLAKTLKFWVYLIKSFGNSSMSAGLSRAMLELSEERKQ